MATRRHSFVPRLAVLEDRCVPALVANPDGLTIHDSVTHTNWLANANLAANPLMHFGVDGINPDGSMTWTQALKWVYEMNQYPNPDGTVGYLHHTDWTLPGNFGGAGFNQAVSDMGELYYTEFAGQAGESVSDIFAATPRLGDLFKNFQPYLYWDGDNVFPGGAEFSFGTGYTSTTKDINVSYVIPEYPDGPPPPPAPDPGSYNTMPAGSVAVSPSLVSQNNGQVVHDTALDVYWLADANLAKTNTFGLAQGVNPDPKNPAIININPDGSMNHITADAWIVAMNQADYLGHNNWRLPIATDTSANFYISGSGVGIAFQGSELGELYYKELGSQAGSNILLTHDSAASLFRNFQPYTYWSGTHTDLNPNGNGYSSFSFGSGFQGANFDKDQMYVIPVYDGPRFVAAVGENNGAAQRSMVTSIQVTFNTAVSIAPGAFTLTYLGGPAGTVGSTVGHFAVSTTTAGGVTVATLSDFSGADTTIGISATAYGSLIDGRYALTVTGSAVTANGVPMPADFTFADGGSTTGNQLYRLFGDSNGDRVVNVADLTNFRSVYGATATDATFDVDLNGVINVADLAAFRAHFGVAV
jgi:hypothetical protein